MATTTQTPTGRKPAAGLSKEEILRYSRHLIMPEVGMEGQLKLKNAKVLLIGTGGLGAPLGLYLAAAGVGKLGLVDFDVVDFTNLQRQVTFGTSDVGKPKSQAARARLSNLNPDIQIDAIEAQLTSANALELFKDYDIIVDGTDNFPTRYLVNDACILLGKPNVYGSIFRFEGQVTVFGMPDGPCYRCLYPEPPPPGLVPSCAEGGVRGEEAPAPNVQVPEITPRELKSRLDRGDDLFILDVREPHEFQICNLKGHLIPLGELPRRVHEVDSSREIVAHCRSGKRSAEAVDFLRKAGFRKVLNLKGGILAWSDEVDPSVPKY